MPFHVSTVRLGPGSTILPGNWGRIVRSFGRAHPHALREAALEQVRAAEFAHLPSRFEGAFCINDLDAANRYFYGTMVNDATSFILYDVSLVDPQAPSHATDWRAVDPPSDGLLDLEWTRAYWRGDHRPLDGGADCREMLTLSPLQINHVVMEGPPARW